ncbi:MAG: DUF721 domain-containing protein [Nitrospirae bacterium]|nr:DUF721 domain-containing protein [Nitrospirota bacterium]
MHRAGDILRGFLKGLGSESALTINAIRKKWEDIVGKTVSVHTYPDGLRNNMLFVLVDTPQWMHHLSFYKQEILEKLNTFGVKDVRFKVGKLPEQDPGLRIQGSKAVLQKNLTKEDTMYIEDTVDAIKDDDLKIKLRRLLQNALTKGKLNRT